MKSAYVRANYGLRDTFADRSFNPFPHRFRLIRHFSGSLAYVIAQRRTHGWIAQLFEEFLNRLRIA